MPITNQFNLTQRDYQNVLKAIDLAYTKYPHNQIVVDFSKTEIEPYLNDVYPDIDVETKFEQLFKYLENINRPKSADKYISAKDIYNSIQTEFIK